VDRKRALTVETWPRRKPRYPSPAADAPAPEMRTAETHSASASAAAEMSTASEVSTTAEVCTSAEMSTAAHRVRCSTAATTTASAASSSWSRVSSAR
jgi:hypothetical protein